MSALETFGMWGEYSTVGSLGKYFDEGQEAAQERKPGHREYMY
jgi:hypothetical protein